MNNQYKGWHNKRRVLVRYGGSHRQIKRQHEAFQRAGIPIESCGAFTLGSKACHGIIPDAPEARTLLKRVGGSICKQQWSHLKDGDPNGITGVH